MLTVCGLEQRYLDVDANVNWIFVKQLLAGQKKAFKLSEVRRIELPRYDELSIKVLLDMIHNDQAICVYLRDDVSDKTPAFGGVVLDFSAAERPSPHLPNECCS